MWELGRVRFKRLHKLKSVGWRWTPQDVTAQQPALCGSKWMLIDAPFFFFFYRLWHNCPVAISFPVLQSCLSCVCIYSSNLQIWFSADFWKRSVLILLSHTVLLVETKPDRTACVSDAQQGFEGNPSWHLFSPCWRLMCSCSGLVSFHRTRDDNSRFVMFQSPSWGTAAPPPHIACTPFCTSTPAPSRSPPSAGRTASLVALWDPSWQCHAMAVAWVRHTHVCTFTHRRKWVVGEQMASRNKQEIRHNPDMSILPLVLTNPSGSFALRPQQACFCPTDSWTGDSVKHGSVSCINWFITLGPYQRVWSRGLEGKTMWGWFRAAADFMLGAEEQWWDDSEYSVTQRNEMWWASEPTSLQAFSMFSQESPGRSGGMSALLKADFVRFAKQWHTDPVCLICCHFSSWFIQIFLPVYRSKTTGRHLFQCYHWFHGLGDQLHFTTKQMLH